MKAVCYFLCWNEKFYIPFLHKHYSSFCEKIIMYDQYSNDGSIELAKSLGIEVRHFGRPGTLNDDWYLQVKNHAWKECRDKGIDYVIIVDADEFVVLPQQLSSTCPTMIGFNMISDHLPENDMFELRNGYVDMNYAKQAIFSPDAMQEINFVHGCHRNHKVGNITTGDECRLYHYRCIGGYQRLVERHLLYRARMSKFNLDHRMGAHYLHSADNKKIEWDYMMSKAEPQW